MTIPVLIEPIGEGKYRASSGGPLELTAEAPTREEAMQSLQRLFERRLASGAEVLQMPVSPLQHSLAPYAGIWRDDPLIDQWRKAISEYRDGIEQDPDSI